MSLKKIIIIFFSLVVLVLLLWFIFKVTNERQLPQNKIEQKEENIVLELEESLESENILKSEAALPEEVVVSTNPISTSFASNTKKQMIVIEKEK